jgi:diguanylate cyclase (GGDEF)-like protein
MATPNNILPLPNKAEILSEKLIQWVEDHKSIFQLLIDAYCVVDASNKVIDFNEAFTELCGESHRKTLKIGDFCQLLKTEHCPDQCPSRQIASSLTPVRFDEISASSKSANSLKLILTGIPIFSDQKEFLGSLLNIRNVSAESELQKKYDQRKQQSVTDGLTSLYNKTYAEQSLFRMLKISLRELKSLSVCLVDIDHFKKVNDTYGHQAGDHVLSVVSKILQEEARDSDIVGRFGGEEFLIILSNNDQKGAKIFAERVRKRIEKTEINFEGKNIPVAVSLGTSTFFKNWTKEMDVSTIVKELIHQADTGLYFAKRNGRNQTAQYESLSEEDKKKAIKS